jgi:DNA-binding MarR family transcriptional regulator
MSAATTPQRNTDPNGDEPGKNAVRGAPGTGNADAEADGVGSASDLPETGVRLRVGDWRLASWRSFLRAHAHIARQLEADLQRCNKIGIASYDVLVQLAEAPGNRLRMSDLAEAVLLSRSGVTRLIDRMQREALVERQPDPIDARGLYTVMTVKGRNALRDAAGVHLASVSRLFVDKLSEDELRELERLMLKLDPVPAPGAEEPDDACGVD